MYYTIIQLLSFDEVNMWIYWLLTKIIFTELQSARWISFFFKSQLIHTFTESKDSNCFILYFEEIMVFWNKKLHVHCPDVVLRYCLHHHPIIWIFYHLIYFLMFRPTKWQIHRPHFVFVLMDAQINYFFSLVDWNRIFL